MREMKEIFKKYKIKYIIMSAYHSETNNMIKKGHKSIINALLKLSVTEKGN
jgi:hypothetical protein